MKRLPLVILVTISHVFGTEILPSPYAAAATKLEFEVANGSNFPFAVFTRTDVLGQHEVSFQLVDTFRFHSKDYDGDGIKEWIVVLRGEHPKGEESALFFIEREKKLFLVLRAKPYFTLIPRKDSLPDIEEWYKNGEFSTRQRWRFDIGNKRYERSWVEFYNNDVLIESSMKQEGGTGKPATHPLLDSEAGEKTQPESKGRSR